MSSFEIAVRVVAGVALVAGNALFVVSEFALTRLRSFDEARATREAGALPWRMTEQLEIYLTACQLGISMTSIVLGIVAEPAVTALIAPGAELVGLEGRALSITSVVIAVVIINLIHKIWGEQAPTYLGVERPLQVARVTAPLLYAWTKVMYPIVIAGDSLAKLTLRAFGIRMTRSWTREGEPGPDENATAGEARRKLIDALSRSRLPRDRRDEVVAAFEIGSLPVREIMTAREDIGFLDAARTWTENVKVLAREGKTRLPLVRGSLDEPLGFVYVPAVFQHLDELSGGETGLERLAAPLLWVSDELDVAAFIDRLQDERQEIALVHDDRDRLVGLVTATDAFEAIAGQLEDPLDVA